MFARPRHRFDQARRRGQPDQISAVLGTPASARRQHCPSLISWRSPLRDGQSWVLWQRRRFDPDFRAGAVQVVKETGWPIAQVAGELGINGGTLANWVTMDRLANRPANGKVSESEREELLRLRREVVELQWSATL